MLMNFDLVKWRLASQSAQHQPQEVIQEQNAVMQDDAIKYLIKNLFR
jgi:hypothetical protein